MLKINNVGVSAIATSVPKNCISNFEFSSIYGKEDVNKLITSIGVYERRVSDSTITSADLCFDAARNLFKNTEITESDVEAVIFVSQTSEYQLPATACILQNKLNLDNSVLAFDINMGCSGYVYGLQVASSLVNTGLKHVLLLVGDTVSKLVKPGDRSTELLFGDAGSATVVSHKPMSNMKFNLGTDGSGFQHIIAKHPIQSSQTEGRARNYSYLEMDGGEVFTFTLKVVPKLVNQFLNELGIEPTEVDNCFYHQANHFMLKHLAKKSKLTPHQVPVSIDKFGNTSGASIAVTICSELRDSYKNTLLVGFGVGLSWGVVHCDLSDTVILPISELING
ncbi:ketoacyl-ACP synthase III [Vibrio alginolyticus]|nr:ketoacyl-ACP synthase III [Vibrio alginolyticus]